MQLAGSSGIFLAGRGNQSCGAAALSELPPLSPLGPAELKTLLAEGGIALDVRPGEAFAAGHVPGSVNIALSGQFASWAGALLGLDSRPVLIAESEAAMAEARMRLARIGLEDARGYLNGGVEAWEKSWIASRRTAADFGGRFEPTVAKRTHARAGRAPRAGVEDGHIEAASWWPLDNFKVAPPEIDRNVAIAVHCKGGYRSMIACSLLQRAGFENVVNVVGGFDAWQAAKLPVAAEKPVGA